MNRRGFLQFVGAFAAGAALPIELLSEKIAYAPAWAKDLPTTLYRVTVPLVAGNYTFTANAGDKGTYIGGVQALGGETLFEVPCSEHMPDACLKLGAIYYPMSGWFGEKAEQVVTAEEFLAASSRGDPVKPA